MGCTRCSVLDLPVPPATASLSGLTSDLRATPQCCPVSPWTPGPQPQSWLLQMLGDSRLQGFGHVTGVNGSWVLRSRDRSPAVRGGEDIEQQRQETTDSGVFTGVFLPWEPARSQALGAKLDRGGSQDSSPVGCRLRPNASSGQEQHNRQGWPFLSPGQGSGRALALRVGCRRASSIPPSSHPSPHLPRSICGQVRAAGSSVCPWFPPLYPWPRPRHQTAQMAAFSSPLAMSQLSTNHVLRLFLGFSAVGSSGPGQCPLHSPSS